MADEDECAEGEYNARLKMCRLTFLRPATATYSLFLDQYGTVVTVKRGDAMNAVERAEAIRRWELMYPPDGSG